MGAVARAAVIAGAMGLGLVAPPIAAVAQSYPARPITLIIHSAPGGAPDVVNRLLAEKVSTIVGQPIVLEFRPGGGAVIGATAVAKARPDGYTLGFLGSTIPAAQGLGKSLTFDVRDYVPVGQFMNSRIGLVVSPALGVSNVEELIARAKAQPGKLNFASTGYGSTPHVAAELFMQATGTKLTQVPYQAGMVALQDLIAGRIDLFFEGTTPTLQLHQTGKIRMIAVTGARRLPSAPEVPTFREAGYGNAEYLTWGAWVAPPNTPRDLTAKISAALAQATRDETIRRRFEDAGIDPVTGGPEELAAFIQSEVDKYRALAKAANIRLD